MAAKGEQTIKLTVDLSEELRTFLTTLFTAPAVASPPAETVSKEAAAPPAPETAPAPAPAPEQEEEGELMNLADMRAKIQELYEKRLAAGQTKQDVLAYIKATVAQFGAATTADLPPQKRAAFVRALCEE